MQATTVHYDNDTGILNLTLDSGEEYQITNPGHARQVKEKLSPGGVISDSQKFWLEKYRVAVRQSNRDQLKSKLSKLRQELRHM